MYPILISCHRDIYYATILDAHMRAFIPLYSLPERFFGHFIMPSVNQGFDQSFFKVEIFSIISSVNRSNARSSADGPSLW